MIKAGPRGSSRIVHDEHLNVSMLLNEAAVAEELRRQSGKSKAEIRRCMITHIRYQPGVSCVVAYEVETARRDASSPLGLRLYGKCLREESYDRAVRRVADDPWTSGRLLASPLACPESRSLLFEFPYDTRLKALRVLDKPQEMARLLHRGEKLISAYTSTDGLPEAKVDRLLRYKPETRCIVRAVLGSGESQVEYALRFDRADRAGELLKRTRLVHAALAGLADPRVLEPVAVDLEQGITAMPWVDGTRLSEKVRSKEVPELFYRTGGVLARLHGRTVAGLPELEAERYERRLESQLDALAAVCAEVAPAVENLRRSAHGLFSRSRPSPTGLVHGDFHQGQVVMAAAKIWLLDLDSAGMGETAMDLGNCIAQLHILDLKGSIGSVAPLREALLDGYRSMVPWTVDEARLRWWTVVGLLELAAKQVRRLHPEWPAKVMELLTVADEVMSS